jgi:hypothetical protein
MTMMESLAMCWCSHAQISVEALKRIHDDPRLSEVERAHQFKVQFDHCCDEWKNGGLQTAIHLMEDNQNSRLDFRALGGTQCEFGPGARKPNVSAFAEVKGDLVRQELGRLERKANL